MTFVPCQSISAQEEMQGLQPIANADTVFRIAISGELLLKGLAFFAKDIPCRPHEAFVGGINCGFQLLVGVRQNPRTELSSAGSSHHAQIIFILPIVVIFAVTS